MFLSDLAGSHKFSAHFNAEILFQKIFSCCFFFGLSLHFSAHFLHFPKEFSSSSYQRFFKFFEIGPWRGGGGKHFQPILMLRRFFFSQNFFVFFLAWICIFQPTFCISQKNSAHFRCFSTFSIPTEFGFNLH